MRPRESANAQCPPVSFHCNGCTKSRAQLQYLHGPAPGLLGVAVDLQVQPVAFGEDFKCIEREEEPIAACLQVGFFARPAGEECGLKQLAGMGQHPCCLGTGEESSRQAQGVDFAARIFDINSDRRANGNGDEADPAGMRDVLR